MTLNWIKCSDRIPEERVHVLLFDNSEGFCVGYIYLGYWTHHPIGSYATDGCLFDVTHWMTLPKNPMSDEEHDFNKMLEEDHESMLKKIKIV